MPYFSFNTPDEKATNIKAREVNESGIAAWSVDGQVMIVTEVRSAPFRTLEGNCWDIKNPV
ncbi:MAG: hypothetical protein DCO95_03250 [Roseivirga sp. XM-24bin3]|nr:MAG: hypothetical protein DCO95_03250 [Roseivirga sp. XM-24bin3]